MFLHHTALASSILAAPLACTAVHDESANVASLPVRAPVEIAHPMASFARMVPGEWRLTAPGLKGLLFDTWHWGPGQHSMRVMTDGSAASGEPWRALDVYYWHPARKKVCVFGLSSFARGVREGTIEFDGETAEGVFDLYQTGQRRKMGLRWSFDGPDKYHDILLEATGPAGLEWMNAWDHVRSHGPPAPRLAIAEETPKSSERLTAFEPLFDQSFEAKGEGASGDALHLQSTVEWIPYADGIYARTTALAPNGERAHLLDTYFFHHTGTDALRCLALSSSGGVYEGGVTVLGDGALQIDLASHEGKRVGSLAVRLDFEKDGRVRARMWSLDGTERTSMLDVHHSKVELKKD